MAEENTSIVTGKKQKGGVIQKSEQTRFYLESIKQEVRIVNINANSLRIKCTEKGHGKCNFNGQILHLWINKLSQKQYQNDIAKYIVIKKNCDVDLTEDEKKKIKINNQTIPEIPEKDKSYLIDPSWNQKYQQQQQNRKEAIKIKKQKKNSQTDTESETESDREISSDIEIKENTPEKEKEALPIIKEEEDVGEISKSTAKNQQSTQKQQTNEDFTKNINQSSCIEDQVKKCSHDTTKPYICFTCSMQLCLNCKLFDSFHSGHDIIKDDEAEQPDNQQQIIKSSIANTELKESDQLNGELSKFLNNSILTDQKREIESNKKFSIGQENTQSKTKQNTLLAFGNDSQNEGQQIVRQVWWIEENDKTEDDYSCLIHDEIGYLRFKNKSAKDDVCSFCDYEIMFVLSSENSNYLKIECSDCYKLNKNVSQSCCQIIKRDLPEKFSSMIIPNSSKQIRPLADCNDYVGKQGRFGHSVEKDVKAYIYIQKSVENKFFCPYFNSIKSLRSLKNDVDDESMNEMEIENCKKITIEPSRALKLKMQESQQDCVPTTLVDLFNKTQIQIKNNQKSKKKKNNKK